MGVHANLLESCRGTTQLLSLRNLLSQSSTLRIPLESGCFESPLHLLPVRLLGLGHRQCAKESIQTVGTWYSFQQESIPPIAMARPSQSKNYPDRPGCLSSGGWLVYVDHSYGSWESTLINLADGKARKIHYTCDLYFVGTRSLIISTSLG